MTKLEKSKIDLIFRKAPLPHRKTMLIMRRSILAIIPEAEEVISYGMPAFKVNGKVVAGILPAKNHVGYYPFSGSIVKLFPNDLKRYSTTKSAIHVPIDKPLSKTLLKKLIRARISQCQIKTGEVDSSKYSKFDHYWRTLGVAAPARRGLIDNKIFKLSDLRQWSRTDFMQIHAMGPKASSLIISEMQIKKVNFKR